MLELQNVFQKIYHYDAEEWRIPDTQSYKFLRKRINNFLNDFEDRATLLIVYYGGQYVYHIALNILKARFLTFDSRVARSWTTTASVFGLGKFHNLWKSKQMYAI